MTAQEAVGKLSAVLAESGDYYTARGGWARWLVKGHASVFEVRIRAWEAGPGGRNSWRPEFSGTVSDLPQGGSQLSGTVGTHRSVVAFPIGWFATAGLFFLIGSWGAVASALTAHWRAALPYLALTGAAVVMVAVRP